ncbi:hypothetical protein [Clostridium beijerinckii]|uniref:hypothetical protein n=1 Tax=Clostridium beijerinckii TaxID=1520 RepID=UPI0009D28DA1|nr:hypothetical protein [Clostridium beijerinckii]NRT76326.1 hypothetical protein [Clostridium beijerinckii]OOM48637.1 hypothetical protein CBEIJ_21090 [Clostridium beijerinckii]
MRYLKTNNRNWRKLCKGEIRVEQLQIEINKERVRNLEKPILFNTEMVKAILEGRKLTTRRIVKGNVQELNIIGSCSNDGVNFNYVSFGNGNINDIKSVEIKERIKAPYLPGDILYVRETWMMQSMSNSDKKAKFLFKAEPNERLKEVILSSDRYEDLIKYAYKNGWQPSLFMPKEAARIFLKVTDVRVERIQDITEEQIKKEGIREEFPPLAEDAFRELWDSTTKDYKWSLNPWVWVIEFERIEK